MSRRPSFSPRGARPVIVAATVVALTATGIGLLSTPAGATSGTRPPGTAPGTRPPGTRPPGTMPPATEPAWDHGGPYGLDCEGLPPKNPNLTVRPDDIDLNLDGVVDPLAITPVPGTTDRYVLETNYGDHNIRVELKGPGRPEIIGYTGLQRTWVPEIIIELKDTTGHVTGSQHWYLSDCHWQPGDDANQTDPPTHPKPVTAKPKYTG
jgi:hypothetical protein